MSDVTKLVNLLIRLSGNSLLPHERRDAIDEAQVLARRVEAALDRAVEHADKGGPKPGAAEDY